MKKKLNKIKFLVEFNPSTLEKIGDLMSKMDLGISGILQPQYYTCGWNTTTKIDKVYKTKMKKRVKEAFELDGSRVLSIKLTKWKV